MHTKKEGSNKIMSLNQLRSSPSLAASAYPTIGKMTVSSGSRDAEGDARGTAQFHWREVAGDWFSSPAPVGAPTKAFGSRFWALASESDDSDGEIWEEEGAAAAGAGDRSAWSPPPSRVLDDFLGLDQGDLGPAGRSLCHWSSSRLRSPEIRRDTSFCSANFLPLSGAKVGARGGGASELSSFKLQVGAWSFEVPALSSSPVVQGASPSAPLILQVDVGDQRSLCVVNDQPIGNPKRKV
jgi:hypothetical protein